MKHRVKTIGVTALLVAGPVALFVLETAPRARI
jgi:hypothetical protein